MHFAILQRLIDLLMVFNLWQCFAGCRTAMDVLLTLRDMDEMGKIGVAACVVVLGATIYRTVEACLSFIAGLVRR